MPKKIEMPDFAAFKTMRELLIARAKSLMEFYKNETEDHSEMSHVAFPMGLKVGERKARVAILPLSGDKAIRAYELKSMHLSLESNKCNSLVVIMDTWTTQGEKHQSIDEVIRQRDAGLIKRQEALILIAGAQGELPYMVVQRYKRVPGNKDKKETIEWGEVIEMSPTEVKYYTHVLPREWEGPGLAEGSA